MLYYAREHADVLSERHHREYTDITPAEYWFFPLTDDELACVLSREHVSQPVVEKEPGVLRYAEQNMREWKTCTTRETMVGMPESCRLGNHSPELYHSHVFPVLNDEKAPGRALLYYPAWCLDALGNTCITILNTPLYLLLSVGMGLSPHG